MAYKLKTSKSTEEILCRIEASENISWPTLLKLSIALSIKKGRLSKNDFQTNPMGRELNRQTILGDYDAIFKCLIEFVEKKHLTDDEYFPSYVKAHIDRGAVILESEQRYGSDFIIHLTELEKSI